jgi:ATP-dependent helicase/DNAse subunit B
MCGFRFFARRLLKLEALKEPEDGMDILQLGTLNHEILEATYMSLAEQGAAVTPEYADFALATLHEKAASLLANAPRRLGFRASALWEQEKEALVRRLEALVRLDFSGSSPIDKAFPSDQPRYAYRFEVEFGKADGFGIFVGGEWLRIAGKIDRVDWQGDRAIVIDYKTGSTEIPTSEIARGRNFQMMLYLLAAERLFEAGEIGGAYWHLGNRKTSGQMLSSSEDDRAAIAAAKEHLARNLARGRAGDFATEANKLEDGRCAHHCDYHQMCRMAILGKKREI